MHSWLMGTVVVSPALARTPQLIRIAFPRACFKNVCLVLRILNFAHQIREKLKRTDWEMQPVLKLNEVASCSYAHEHAPRHNQEKELTHYQKFLKSRRNRNRSTESVGMVSTSGESDLVGESPCRPFAHQILV